MRVSVGSFCLGELWAEEYVRTNQLLLRFSWLSSHFSMSWNLAGFCITSEVEGCFFLAPFVGPSLLVFWCALFPLDVPAAASTVPKSICFGLVTWSVGCFLVLTAFSRVQDTPTGGVWRCLHFTQATLPLVLYSFVDMIDMFMFTVGK